MSIFHVETSFFGLPKVQEPYNIIKKHPKNFCFHGGSNQPWLLFLINSKIILTLYCRYIVAAKDIKEGETIMEEEPAVRCPPYSTKPVCLGCYTFVQKG